jgi:hypothetical protein
MDMKILMKKAGLFVGLCLIIALSASSASAWGGGGRHGGYNHGYYGRGGYGGYHGWGFYRPYWGFGFSGYGGYLPSVGAVVAYMPEGYSSFFVNGVRYYYCDGYYFRPCPSGYVIVQEPAVTAAVAAEPAAQSQTAAPKDIKTPAIATIQSATESGAKTAGEEAMTINIPNSNGGYTSVKLVKFKDGFKGPQGEYYAGHPTVEELKVLYGK